jgi:hypothetical protein
VESVDAGVLAAGSLSADDGDLRGGAIVDAPDRMSLGRLVSEQSLQLVLRCAAQSDASMRSSLTNV